MDRIRLGLVGTGGVVMRRHLPALKSLSDTCQIMAVARGSAQRLPEAIEKTGAEKGYARWQELIADPDIDAVLIASPNALHAEQAQAAMEHGKDVLCEKPPAISAAQASAMADCAKRHKRILQYGFLMRFAPDTQLARSVIQQNQLGTVYYIRAQWLRQRGYPTQGSWFTNQRLSGGGPLMDIGSHLLDRTLYILNFPKVEAVSAMTHGRLRDSTVSSVLNTGKKSGITGVCDVEDLATCLFRLEGGISLLLETSFALNRAEVPVSTEFLGDKAGLRLALGQSPVQFGEKDNQLTEVTVAPLDAVAEKNARENGAPWLYQQQWMHFAECIQTRKEPMANAEQGIQLMTALEAAYQSAREGREIRLSHS